MRTKTKTLVLAMTTALFASGVVHAQVKGDPGAGTDPSGPSNGAPLGVSISGDTCSGSGGAGCPGAIPDSGGGSLVSTFDVLLCTEVVDANVGIDTTHTWVGDLVYTVTSPGGGASVTVIDRPGEPASFFGCSGDDIEAMLNDSAVAPVEDECALAVPTIDGIYTPNNPLAAFNGQVGNGTWTIEVTDNAGGDTGTLNDWSLDLVCLNHADLAVAKSGPATVVAGTEMTYTIDVSNAGPANAVDVIVTDTIPAGTTYVSDTDTCVEAPAGTLTCTLGGIASGAVDSFDITVEVGASETTGTVLTNTATVTTVTDDPNGANDSDTADTVVTREADITVVKTQITANPIVAGEGGASNLCYNINVANAGPSDVTGLTTVDTGSPYVGIVSVGVTDWLDDLAAGTNTDHVACFTVLANAPVGVFTNTATATGSTGGEDLGDPLNHTSDVATPITRVVNIDIVKVGPPSVTAGSGAGNLVHTVTVTNNGPSDVTGLEILDELSGFPSGGVTPVSGPLGLSTHNIAAGANAVFQIVGTVDLSAEEGEDITNTASTTGNTGGGETIIGDSDSATTTIAWPTATFNVTKLGDGGPIDVALDCTDSTGLGFGVPDPAEITTDGSMDWRRFDHNTGTECHVVQTLPDGYYEASRSADCDVLAVADGGVYDCVITNLETVARFHVTKDFSDGSTDDVEVTLTCDTGLPLTQMLVIAGGDPTGVTFVVKDFVDATMSCAVTEVTNTPGYTIDASGCEWNLVNSIESPFGCVVNNAAQPASFTVWKQWEIYNEGGDFINEDVPVWIYCNNDIVGGSNCGTNCSYKSGVLGDGESLTAVVDTTLRSAVCYATEATQPSGVDTTDNCGSRTIVAGASDSCTFVNTVFFEGIPTLSQYGLAILALLMLGMGMVGFRRFV